MRTCGAQWWHWVGSAPCRLKTPCTLMPQADGLNRRVKLARTVPPCDAFWSVTLYDARGFPVPNARDRHAVGSPHGLLRDADGGITLHISHAPPAAARDRNWLPAPARGRFVLCCRFYEPREELLQQKWRMPPVRELQQPRL